MSPNLVLIGMPGAGKSTIGVLLAKLLSYHFIDTDLVIQAAEQKRLHDIIRTAGTDAFRRIEEERICELQASDAVIATGGSVVYSDAAMQHLRQLGTIIWLRVPLAQLQQRLDDLVARGVVMAPGQSLADLLAEREPLYARYSDLTLDCGSLDHTQCVQHLADLIKGSHPP